MDAPNAPLPNCQHSRRQIFGIYGHGQTVANNHFLKFVVSVCLRISVSLRFSVSDRVSEPQCLVIFEQKLSFAPVCGHGFGVAKKSAEFPLFYFEAFYSFVGRSDEENWYQYQGRYQAAGFIAALIKIDGISEQSCCFLIF